MDAETENDRLGVIPLLISGRAESGEKFFLNFFPKKFNPVSRGEVVCCARKRASAVRAAPRTETWVGARQQGHFLRG
jgi:hypothetical protein